MYVNPLLFNVAEDLVSLDVLHESVEVTGMVAELGIAHEFLHQL